MLLAWRKHRVLIDGGYITGFPGDTPGLKHDPDAKHYTDRTPVFSLLRKEPADLSSLPRTSP